MLATQSDTCFGSYTGPIAHLLNSNCNGDLMSGDFSQFFNPDYLAFKSTWEIVRDSIAGKRLIEQKSQTYLPAPSLETKPYQYESYLKRAFYYNATSCTRDALCGAIFSKDPVIKVPDLMDWVNTNIDGRGSSINQLCHFAVNEVLTTGRIGFFVDYHATGPATISQVASGEIHPFVYPYVAENIVDWDVSVVGNSLVTTYVLLRETVSIRNKTGLGFKTYYQYRSLYLDENGIYNADVYRDNNAIGAMTKDMQLIQNPSIQMQELISQSQPRDSSGRNLNFIPFYLVGSEKNQIDHMSKAPLEDIARANISHYQLSADVHLMLHISALPTLWVNGVPDSWVKSHGNKIALGSMSSICTPPGANVSFLQIESQQVIVNELRAKEVQLQMLGARIQSQSSGEAAETVRMRQSGEAARLATIGNNVSLGAESFLRAILTFSNVGTEDEIKYKLNNDFFTSTVDQPMLTELRADQTAGLITTMEWRMNAKSAGVQLDPTIQNYEDLQSVLELEPPGGMQEQQATQAINTAPENGGLAQSLEQAAQVSG